MSELLAIWLGWFGLVVLLPLTVIVVVIALWKRLLCDEHGRLKQNPPYASITGFILCGWYSYLAVGFFVVFGNLVPFFNFTSNPEVAHKQHVGEIFCVLAAILCAFAGEFVASRIARRFGKLRSTRRQLHSAH